jgi:hypothetical protein
MGLTCLMRAVSGEEAALLLVVQAVLDRCQSARLESLVSDPSFDWDRFWELAHEQQVVPLAARRLTGPDLASLIPGPIVQQAAQTRLVWVGQALALHAELHRLARALKANGIPVIPLKGTTLAERLYGALDGRSTSDIDILVPESRLLEARSVLGQCGYAAARGVSAGIEEHSFHGVPYVRSVQSRLFVVELHWKLSNPRFVTVDYDALWARVLAQRGPAAALLPLPTVEMLMHLALHMPKHTGGALRLLADIDRLVRREAATLDWTEASRVAEAWGVQYALYFALVRARALFDTPIPPSAMAALAPGPLRAGLVHLVASPLMLLRPPARDYIRITRLQLAHCAMQRPLLRLMDAYTHYILAPGKLRSASAMVGVPAQVLGGLRGVAWTGLALAASIVDLTRRPRVDAHIQALPVPPTSQVRQAG